MNHWTLIALVALALLGPNNAAAAERVDLTVRDGPLAAYPGNVGTTIVDGRIVVRDGALQTVDLEAHWREWRALTRRVAEFAKTLE